MTSSTTVDDIWWILNGEQRIKTKFGDEFQPQCSDISYNAQYCSLDRGATIQSSKSNQEFSSTHWNGDSGVGFEFVFRLKPLRVGMSEKELKEIETLKKLQKKYPNI